MISFQNIHKYSNFESYQRLKKIKYQQSIDRLSKNNCKKKTYQDYLNKIAGFQCCKPAQNCCYCVNGKNEKGVNCLNPPGPGRVCCDCYGTVMITIPKKN
jgi:hypothetical protein